MAYELFPASSIRDFSGLGLCGNGRSELPRVLLRHGRKANPIPAAKRPSVRLPVGSLLVDEQEVCVIQQCFRKCAGYAAIWFMGGAGCWIRSSCLAAGRVENGAQTVKQGGYIHVMSTPTG
jgi:hypothetical protein